MLLETIQVGYLDYKARLVIIKTDEIKLELIKKMK